MVTRNKSEVVVILVIFLAFLAFALPVLAQDIPSSTPDPVVAENTSEMVALVVVTIMTAVLSIFSGAIIVYLASSVRNNIPPELVERLLDTLATAGASYALPKLEQTAPEWDEEILLGALSARYDIITDGDDIKLKKKAGPDVKNIADVGFAPNDDGNPDGDKKSGEFG